MVHNYHLLVRRLFLTGLVLALLEVAYDLLGHPAVATGSDAMLYLALFALAVCIYSWFAIFQTRGEPEDGSEDAREDNERNRLALRYGTIFGLVCGGVWILEVLVANVWGPGLSDLNITIYYGSTLVALFLPGGVGVLVGWRTGWVRAGLKAGLVTGMLGGLILFLAVIVPLSVLLLEAGQHDPQSISEFHKSGLPDLPTFIVGDYLAAMTVHLWIGLVSGLILGALGGLVGKELSHSRSL